eukprot:Sdes_comp17969_c0_seq2m7228
MMWMRLVISFVGLWPPYLGAGIRVSHVCSSFKTIKVEMKQRFYNANWVGVHYGGSLYSMTDPFYMIMLIKHLGPQYVVWDKSAQIRYKKPGKGTKRTEKSNPNLLF